MAALCLCKDFWTSQFGFLLNPLALYTLHPYICQGFIKVGNIYTLLCLGLKDFVSAKSYIRKYPWLDQSICTVILKVGI